MIMSDRDVFAGAHVTPEVKDALRQLSLKQNKSMSALIYEAIKDKLAKEGVEVTRASSNEEDVPLPFVH
jgi:predicted transcriptional regulator